ncbi:hypothetical protein RDABS01_037570, partial [Bienertia sinuspersici]
WEVLVIIPPEKSTHIIPPSENNYVCLFPNNAISLTKLLGKLPFNGGYAFKCELPARNRRRLPFFQPILVRVNIRQGINRAPSEFWCVFGNDPLTAIRTNVTSSAQEVFRCPRPRIVGSHPISVTIEILENDRTFVMPTLARYFLREWVMFHSKIGVEKFVLYDNDSDDDLVTQVESLRKDGFDVRIVYWVWPKAQEAGFSHCALYSTQICDWVAFCCGPLTIECHPSFSSEK